MVDRSTGCFFRDDLWCAALVAHLCWRRSAEPLMAPRDCHDNWRGALSLCSIRSEGSNRPKQMSFSSSARSAASARTGPIATARPTTSSSRRLTAWLGRYVRGRGLRARRSRVWRKFCWTRNMMLPRTNYVPPPSRNPCPLGIAPDPYPRSQAPPPVGRIILPAAPSTAIPQRRPGWA